MTQCDTRVHHNVDPNAHPFRAPARCSAWSLCLIFPHCLMLFPYLWNSSFTMNLYTILKNRDWFSNSIQVRPANRKLQAWFLLEHVFFPYCWKNTQYLGCLSAKSTDSGNNKFVPKYWLFCSQFSQHVLA